MYDIVNRMVKHSLLLDRIFQALSDPTRREILQRIKLSENLTVTDIAGAYSMSLPAVSKHLKVLEDAQLVKRKQSGKEFSFSTISSSFKIASAFFVFFDTTSQS